MIKITVTYAYREGARFDHAYYRDKHLPLVKARMGEACRYYTIDKGLSGFNRGDPPPYVALAHLYCDSVQAFERAFGPHAQEILGDVPNYTDLSPVVQISEVVVGGD
ncbi:EthD family reductase [Roseateles sp. BYS180W]|uniref:EthD family reductase n=1 Tax=Roseateles rivi TaxID=3299028 RepID=A0ABW7FWX5_9BURK